MDNHTDGYDGPYANPGIAHTAMLLYELKRWLDSRPDPDAPIDIEFKKGGKMVIRTSKEAIDE